MTIDLIPKLMRNIVADIDNLLVSNPSNATLLLADAILAQVAGDMETFFHEQQLKIARRVSANVDAELERNSHVWA
jgi:hypothetical protein